MLRYTKARTKARISKGHLRKGTCRPGALLSRMVHLRTMASRALFGLRAAHRPRAGVLPCEQGQASDAHEASVAVGSLSSISRLKLLQIHRARLARCPIMARAVAARSRYRMHAKTPDSPAAHVTLQCMRMSNAARACC